MPLFLIFPLVIIGKFISFMSRFFRIGYGGTWPGEIALRLYPAIFAYFLSQVKKAIVIIAGTNGKTTTARMIVSILSYCGFPSSKIIHNASGANLLNGLVSAFLEKANLWGKLEADFAVFEVDENTLSQVIFNCQFSIFKGKLVIVLLNLFRDQLDRYGEVDIIAEKWEQALRKLPAKTKVILNADDPQIAFLSQKLKGNVLYFGINNPKLFIRGFEHTMDSIFCLNCGHRLSFEGVYYSHLGIWQCRKCGWKRPEPEINDGFSPLPGIYNQYNVLAAAAVAKSLGIAEDFVRQALDSFSPAFGRQEEFEINGKKAKIFLSKNPTGFNESLKTAIHLGAKYILFVLNDRIPDGKDVSWIWDVDFEMLPDNLLLIVSGERVYDLALRLKYSSLSVSPNLDIKYHEPISKIKYFEKLKDALDYGIKQIGYTETLYILPTYSAMLEVRDILKGRKIL